jgi:hypothetical protein
MLSNAKALTKQILAACKKIILNTDGSQVVFPSTFSML